MIKVERVQRGEGGTCGNVRMMERLKLPLNKNPCYMKGCHAPIAQRQGKAWPNGRKNERVGTVADVVEF